MIATIVIPTPKRIKRAIEDFKMEEKIKSEGVKERILLYGLIAGSVGVIIKNPVPAKPIVVGTLIYYGISYEVLMRWYEKYGEDEEIMELMRNYNYSLMPFGRQMFL